MKYIISLTLLSFLSSYAIDGNKFTKIESSILDKKEQDELKKELIKALEESKKSGTLNLRSCEKIYTKGMAIKDTWKEKVTTATFSSIIAFALAGITYFVFGGKKK